MSDQIACSYTRVMEKATPPVAVGVRDLKNNLSRHLATVRDGAEIVVTDHGRPIARLVAIDGPTDRLAELVREGLVRPARSARSALPRPVRGAGPVSDLVADQRR
ncbi:MAG: type II toxin-antitoxin system Phd/YefM family antitoxin [Microthrixaceae bacterium]